MGKHKQTHIKSPDWLDDLARELFKTLNKQTKDRETLSLLCDSYSSYVTASEMLTEHGSLLLDNKPHPALAIQAQAWARYMQAYKILGLGKTAESQSQSDDLDMKELEELGGKLDKEED